MKKYKYCPFCNTSLKIRQVDNEKRLSCSNCGFVHWNNPRPAVSVVLEEFGKILMLKRALGPFKNSWCLPGGFIRHEETPEEAVIREVKEEVGLDIKKIKIISAYRIDNDPRGINIDIIYSGMFTGNIRLSKEHSEWKFFDYKNLPKRIEYKHKDAIDDYLKLR